MAEISPLLSERVIPTRKAARRAAANFADQLLNSPGPSDDEPSDSFREPPPRRQPNVKYRYNAKGKFRSSPLKQTVSPSPPPKHQPKQKPNRKQKPVAPSLPSIHSRKRKASVSFSDGEGTISTLTALSPSPFSSFPTSPLVQSKDLPPPSMISFSTTPPRKVASRAGSMHSLGNLSSKTTSFSQPLSQPSTKKKKSVKSQSSGQLDGHGFGDVDTLVWVLVNDLGVVITRGSHGDDDNEFPDVRMWWPARVVQKQPLRVTLFGDLALSREPSTISSPTSYNIQSIHNLSGVKRFSPTTFQATSSRTSESSDLSPRKKLKTEFCERWEAAVKAMEDADGLKRDGMPEMISAYTGETFSSEDEKLDSLPSAPRNPSQSDKLSRQGSRTKIDSKGKGKEKATLQAVFEVTTDHAWSPPPPDPVLQLPGELVLAQAPRTRSNKYWPAQLISYVPPTKPSGKERYRVKFLDDREHDLTRDKFWTHDEEDFVTCEMGEFESAVQDVEEPDSENERDKLDNNERSPSPQLTDPPPDADGFANLPMRAQLAFVKPVLKAILEGTYNPVSQKHEAFMRGGVARSSLMKRAAVRGGLDPNEVKQSQKLISRWVLGEGFARRANVEPLAEAEASLDPESAHYATALAAAGDGVSEADVRGANEISPDSGSHDGLPQPISPSIIDTQDDNVDAMVVDTPSKAEDFTEPKTNEMPCAPLHESLAEVDTKISVSAGHDNVCQPVPLDDGNGVDDANGMTSVQTGDSPGEPKTNGLPLSVSLHHQAPAPKEDVTEQSDPSGDTELPKVEELENIYISQPHEEKYDPKIESHTLPYDQQPPVLGSPEYETLTTLDKLDYCMNILLPEAIQQLLLWRSGERTTASLLSPEEEERLHYLGEAKAQETDWVYSVLHLREAQARVLRIDMKAKGKSKDRGGDVKVGGTRSRPRRAMV